MPIILVVDDEPMIRTLIAMALEQEGFQVLTAGSAFSAMLLSREHRGEIGLLITDVMMPGMDGPTLAAELLAGDPGMPVLFMSGHCEVGQMDRCRQFEFLPKPFSMGMLLTEVKGLMRGGVFQAAN